MANQQSRVYEAMFLVKTGVASDWEAAKGMIQRIMDRAHVEMVACQLWDERRLAYDIKRCKRAAYILCYFLGDGSAIGGIERDVQLSEHLLRVLILRADHIGPEKLEEIKALPERRADEPQPPADERGRPDWRRSDRRPEFSRSERTPAPARVDDEDAPKPEGDQEQD